jgi:hypothetical protein
MASGCGSDSGSTAGPSGGARSAAPTVGAISCTDLMTPWRVLLGHVAAVGEAAERVVLVLDVEVFGDADGRAVPPERDVVAERAAPGVVVLDVLEVGVLAELILELLERVVGADERVERVAVVQLLTARVEVDAVGVADALDFDFEVEGIVVAGLGDDAEVAAAHDDLVVAGGVVGVLGVADGLDVLDQAREDVRDLRDRRSRRPRAPECPGDWPAARP